MGHDLNPTRELKRADLIANVALEMYQAGKITQSRAIERFKLALGHVDNFNLDVARVIEEASKCE